MTARRDDDTAGLEEQRREFLSYVWGLVLAVVLTAVPFAMVQWSLGPSDWAPIAITVFALAQVTVHVRFFLHVGWNQKREDLQLILFSALILILMGGGTIWILANLASRMHGM